MLAPALSHGLSIGPSDILSDFGLTARSGVVIHNGSSGDQIQAFIPWTALAWTQVHHGVLPLWNPYSVLGMPLAFDWQSAPFSLPSLVGYLFPMHLAYTAAIVLRLVIAGTGGYVLGRVMGMSWLGSTLTGTVFELSGSLSGWAGWPMVNVLAWAGWVLAVTILVLRGRNRTRDTVLLAFAVGLSIYGGHPESVVILMLFLVVFVVVLLVARAARHGLSELASGINVVVGIIAGTALAAPLVLPGVQLAQASARNTVQGYPVLPVKSAVGFVFASFWGGAVHGSGWFEALNYYEVTAYVGIIALVLAGVAVLSRWKDPEVLAFAVVGVVMVCVVYLAPLRSLLDALPNGTVIAWNRSLILVALPIAVLAGLGMDLLVTGFWRRQTVVRTSVGFAIAGLFLVLAGIVFLGQVKGRAETIRQDSFLWPVASTAVGLAVVFVLWDRLRSGRRDRTRPVVGRGWIAGMVLFVTETAFLVSAGSAPWSASATMVPNSAAVVALQRAVGSSTVGFADCPAINGNPSLGVLPNVNAAYAISEMAVYDPVLPIGYYRSWSAATGQQMPVGTTNSYCPSITTATLARLYGLAFVLQAGGGPPVTGAVFDQRIDGEDLYRVPGAAQATLVPVATPGNNVVGTPVAVAHPDPATWRLAASSTGASELRLRLTDTPGWHATLDGQPLALHSWADVMLEARVPPGHHLVVLSYEPTRFTAGLVIAGVTLLVMIAFLVVPVVRRRTQSPSAP